MVLVVPRVRGEEGIGKNYNVSEFYFGISIMEMFWNFIKVEPVKNLTLTIVNCY